jgi:hypothetical protein
MVMGARVYLPSLGRFTQPDPIEGGTLNNYVYVIDPINFHDYSGMYAGCILQCTAPASFFQPAAPVAPLQPAALQGFSLPLAAPESKEQGRLLLRQRKLLPL